MTQMLPLAQMAETVLPTAGNYTFDQSLPFVASLGRAGQAAADPQSASNASGLAAFLGAPLAERSPQQQLRDRQASVRRAATLRTAQRSQDALTTTTPEDLEARAARLLARLQLQP